MYYLRFNDDYETVAQWRQTGSTLTPMSIMTDAKIMCNTGDVFNPGTMKVGACDIPANAIVTYAVEEPNE